MADNPTSGVYEPTRRGSKANSDKSCPSFKITNIRLDSLAKLSKGLQEHLDSKRIGLGVAEYLSYLRPDEQAIVQRLVEGNTKVDIPHAKELKKLSHDHEPSENEINQIIRPKAPVTKKKAIKLREDPFSKYFTENQSPEEIEDTIAKALELLRSQSPS